MFRLSVLRPGKGASNVERAGIALHLHQVAGDLVEKKSRGVDVAAESAALVVFDDPRAGLGRARTETELVLDWRAMNAKIHGGGERGRRFGHKPRGFPLHCFNRKIPLVEGILKEHLTGGRDHSQRLWTLLNLELWHRLFVDPGQGRSFPKTIPLKV